MTMKPAILTAFYVRHEDALSALKALKGRGYRRVAVIHKDSDGRVAIRRSFLRHGLRRGLRAEYSRRLVTDESALILEAPIAQLRHPADLLRESSENPLIFVRNPKRAGVVDDLGIMVSPPSPMQIQERAVHLATTNRVTLKSSKDTVLLDRLKRMHRWIGPVCADLSAAVALGQRATPLVEWILDNQYVIDSSIRDVQQNLSRHFYRELPSLEDGPHRGLPRIYGLARQLVSDTGMRLDRDTIVSFLDAYQSVQTLTTAELWAIPQMLRLALVEGIVVLASRGLTELRDREIADFWANRLISAGHRDPNQLFTMMAELSDRHSALSAHFAFQLLDHLYGEEASATLVRSWLERMFHRPIEELNADEQDRQAKEQIAVGNAFSSLRELVQLDWRDLFEQVSLVDKALRLDPAGIYSEMDFATRDRYRRVIEQSAGRSGRTEVYVAKACVSLASEAVVRGAGVELTHIGAYLIGTEKRELSHRIGTDEPFRERFRRRVTRHHTGVYLTGIGVFLALFTALIAAFGLAGLPATVRVVFSLIAVLPLSQLSVEIMNYLIMRLLPPRALAKMDYRETGIPDEYRTLVVVPMLLTNTRTIDAQVSSIEIRFLANPDENLLYSLFTDYTDCDTQHRSDDDPLLQRAIAGLAGLNERYGNDRFLLLHRQRVWSESERAFIGWERKRGKLEELNRLIDGTRPHDAGKLVYLGDPERLRAVRFIITLDSDTQLPSGTARRMVETLAHPLNRPRLDDEGRIAAGTYTIIQPRVSPSLPSTTGSTFSRLFSLAVGIDPYTRVVSDLNHDLSGEGSYHGKGIYDVRAFSRVLSGRFPEERLLSHDLIEGAHVRVGLASDIELLDEFPQDYLTYTVRQHRWIRGDWQIAAWLRSRVPGSGGDRAVNPLSGFNRWKIADNLRRSLIPVASLALLAVAWMGTPATAVIGSLVVASQLLFHTVMPPLTMATTRGGLRTFSIQTLGHDMLRTLVEASLIPHQSALAVDAIVRVWYRRLISRRKLLEWTVSRSTSRVALRPPVVLGLTVVLSGMASGLAGWALYVWSPVHALIAAPWLLVWIASPFTAWALTRRRPPAKRNSALAAGDERYLRAIARRTWRYYAEFVSSETSWLPPDNYQLSHQNELAMRTSPTNIGLWFLSAAGARDFGYLTGDQVIDLLSKSMRSVAELERFEGHLLNWYDIQTLKPLEPRYVSTVDSGNLVGSLWALEQALEAMITDPVLGRAAFEGLLDTLGVLEETLSGSGQTSRQFREALDAVTEELGSRFADRADAIWALRKVHEMTGPMIDDLRGDEAEAGGPAADATAVGGPAAAYWLGQVHSQTAAWLETCDRYLRWMEIAAEKGVDELAPLGSEAVELIGRQLKRAPSLLSLAAGDVAMIRVLVQKRSHPGVADTALIPWIDRITQAFHDARWLAGEKIASARRLIDDVQRLGESINMRFLYDPRCRLFRIGFNVSDHRPDNAYYDLLASEARIGSFVAVARGEAPVEHWFAMGRPHDAIGARRVLLSWSGTMFEYLMPQLLLRSYDNSLLEKAVSEAVAIQIDYGRKRRVPWGISESAFADLDINKTYQYKAFGIPRLGLKRGLDRELVVAPYASLLALGVAVKPTLKNLRRLDALGMLSDYGYYDAIDFGRQASRDGKRGVLVRTYMSHHQGMGFLSLNNFLHHGVVQDHFHRDPRVRAFEPLLHESIPTGLPRYSATRAQGLGVESIGEVAPSVSRFETPNTATSKTQLLGNGRYSIMVTNSGGGYSQWGDIELNRWRADATRDSGGLFCYIHEPDADHLWSNTYYPTTGTVDSYSADFTLDRAVIRRCDDDIDVKTEIVVSPEDDVEIRRITLVNRSPHRRRLELTSYIELSLAPHRQDLQHPAFNKMFIQTEALPEHHALLAYRRKRRDDEAPVFAAHRLTRGTGTQEEPLTLRFQTDRAAFIGRGRSLENPAGAVNEPEGGQGYVLDPIFSLRADIVLEPGEQQQLSLIVAAGDSRQRVIDLLDTYDDPHAIERAMDFAWAAAQIELRALRVQPDEARRFQQIASHLLIPNARLRAPGPRIVENGKGQSGLWPYGISGDAPILMISIADTRDVGLVRQMLRAHSYWRMQGFVTDLVIVNEEASGYENPLRNHLEDLVRAHPHGAFLVSADQIPREDLVLMTAVARVVLVAARGSLPQQLGMAVDVPELPQKSLRKRAVVDASAELRFMELHYFNGLGGFTDGGREYAIYLGDGSHTPAPWVNVIANPSFGTLVGETGAGFTWYGNSQRNRLTQWSNDPVVDPVSEVIYIRDEDTGAYWSPTASPIRERSAYRARHGAGYSVFEHNSHGIEQELTVFVPMSDTGGEPVKLQRLRLTNATARERTLSVTCYQEWTLGENRESSYMHVSTSWDERSSALLARNRYHPDYPGRLAFAAITPEASSYSGDRTAFLGRNRSAAQPAAMDRVSLSSRVGAGIDPCAALQTSVHLAPGATAEVVCMLGQTDSLEQARELIRAYSSAGAFEISLARTQAWWDTLLGSVEVQTPELAANILLNRWLLYQSLSCRMWGRSATYQSGGAFGFRDQLQDSMAFATARPALAREQILLAAARQFAEGDVQHWWHPPGGAGIRSRISDDLLWLPFVVAHYVRISGDTSVLAEEVPFLNAPPLGAGEHEVFAVPQIGTERGTVFEHCRRAVERGLTAGPHGLPLMGTGDWNDGMNLVGAEGSGESVWLAWFLVDVLRGMQELSDLQGDGELSRSFDLQRTELIGRIEASAWDGSWYLRAFFDSGAPLGSAGNAEAKIDSLPQSWARLSGAGNEARTQTAVQSAWEHLVRPDEALVLLFDPPFDRSDPSPGYIRGYPPGVRENGGQYTHAALWFAMAMARGGDGERAATMLRLLNPIEQTRDPEAVSRYAVEPYAIAADVYRLPGRVGRGGWSWYTGSAAWMYRAWVEEVLGLQIRGEEMRLAPVIPAWWDGFTLRYRHGPAVYHVRVENPDHGDRGVERVELDGQPVPDGVIQLERSESEHHVLVTMCGSVPTEVLTTA
ncbi:MAG: glycosyl transferase [Spirochaetaceae bacterium]|nr:MAG: glycosyl transferase [Spirochaetaceae bacterium]